MRNRGRFRGVVVGAVVDRAAALGERGHNDADARKSAPVTATRSRPLAALFATLALSGCGLPPELKTFYLSREDWEGTRLSTRGKIAAADSVAGAAPNTITILEVGALGSAPSEPLERIRTQDLRAQALAAELERDGVEPGSVTVQALPAGAPASLRESRKPMVVLVHY